MYVDSREKITLYVYRSILGDVAMRLTLKVAGLEEE